MIKLITYTPVDDAMDFSKMHFGFMINTSEKNIYLLYISLPDSIKLWEWISIHTRIQMKVQWCVMNYLVFNNNNNKNSHIVVSISALCAGCPRFNFRLGNRLLWLGFLCLNVQSWKFSNISADISVTIFRVNIGIGVGAHIYPSQSTVNRKWRSNQRRRLLSNRKRLRV
jgi:hypothetical protein